MYCCVKSCSNLAFVQLGFSKRPHACCIKLGLNGRHRQTVQHGGSEADDLACNLSLLPCLPSKLSPPSTFFPDRPNQPLEKYEKNGRFRPCNNNNIRCDHEWTPSSGICRNCPQLSRPKQGSPLSSSHSTCSHDLFLYLTRPRLSQSSHRNRRNVGSRREDARRSSRKLCHI